MKVAVTATGPSLDASLDPRFGRCSYFVVVDSDDMSFEAIENESVSLGHGAGIQSAQFIAVRGVEVVLTGNCGPNAYQTLSAADVRVIVGCAGSVSEVVAQLKAGQLNAINEPNVAGHFGTVEGQHLGMGGGGGGMGGGGMGADQELELLKARAEETMAQLQSITSRISEIQQGGSAASAGVAGSKAPGQASRQPGRATSPVTVDKERCIVCAICKDVCPEDAITLRDFAEIDPQKCNGCGLCVDECPNEALSLSAISAAAP